MQESGNLNCLPSEFVAVVCVVFDPDLYHGPWICPCLCLGLWSVIGFSQAVEGTSLDSGYSELHHVSGYEISYG